MTIDPLHPYENCGGPARCRYCRDILGETPEQACVRLAAENRHRSMRTAALSPRCAGLDATDERLQQAAQFRQEIANIAALAQLKVTPRAYPEPPDPYAIALAKMQENRR